MKYEEKHGFAFFNCCGLFCQRVIDIFVKTINELPILILAASMYTLTDKYFFAACFGLTSVVGII